MANPAKINVIDLKRGVFNDATTGWQTIDTNGTVPIDANLNTEGLRIDVENRHAVNACTVTILAGTDRGAVTANDLSAQIPKTGAGARQQLVGIEGARFAFPDKTFRVKFQAAAAAPNLIIRVTRDPK